MGEGTPRSSLGGRAFRPLIHSSFDWSILFQEIPEIPPVHSTTPLFSAKQSRHSHLQPRNAFHRCTYDPETEISKNAQTLRSALPFAVIVTGARPRCFNLQYLVTAKIGGSPLTLRTRKHAFKDSLLHATIAEQPPTCFCESMWAIKGKKFLLLPITPHTPSCAACTAFWQDFR